jgi:tetratricopeptide (TPR) repeat protein
MVEERNRGLCSANGRVVRGGPVARGLAALALGVCAAGLAVCALTVAGCGATTGSSAVGAKASVAASSASGAVPERLLTDAVTRPDDKVSGLLDVLNQKVASKPNDPLGWRDLGIVQARLGLYKDARVALERAAPQLADDPYLAGYHALTLEMLGDGEGAAKDYERAGVLLPGISARLRTRASLLRAAAQTAEPGDDDAGAGAATVAMLPPADLGGADKGSDKGAGGASSALAVALEMGLKGAKGITVLGPDHTLAWLAADKRGVSDFDDAQARTITAKALAKRGVEKVLATSFLVIEDGTMHVRLALIPLSGSGAGEPASPSIDPGAKGQELLPLARSLPELWKTAGVAAPGGDPASWMPTSLAGALAYDEGLHSFAAGKYSAAEAAFGRAASSCPQVTALARWRDWAKAAAPLQSDALATQLGKPAGVVDALRSHAQQLRKKLEEETGGDVPF